MVHHGTVEGDRAVRSESDRSPIRDDSRAIARFEEFLTSFENDDHEPAEGEILLRVRRNGFVYVLARRSAAPIDALTARQREVAELAGAGRSLDEIAKLLKLSRPCVAKHLQRVYAKLHVESRAALATLVLAFVNGVDGPGN
jgi:DNA-binding CsgD family transcriptional regulator